VNWSVEEGEHWVLLGPNGAGKTTVSRIAAARLFPSSGTADILGERMGRVDVSELHPRIGLCSSALAGRVPEGEPVLSVVLSASYGRIGVWREEYDDSDVERARALLGALGAEGTGAVGAVWDWFARRLNIIHPESMYMHLLARINADAVFSRAMSSGLTRADTGISEVRLEEMKLEALPVGADQLTGLLEALREKGGTFVIDVVGADQTILSLTDEGEPTARRLVTVHEREDGPAPEQHSSFTLPLQEESDGTQRFMNLLPILSQLRDKNSRSVFVVDELENSMHPKLTEDFISSFLEGLGADDRCQLIFTTHEIQLMRSDLLRRDEIWLADKVDGQSRLTRVSDFAGIGVRKDADLLSFYMSGRLGGVPRI